MNGIYGRDLDLNLLRVFVAVAESGSATVAASRLYLTQPAISAALKRLAAAVGAPLFAREGRGLALTARGQRLFATAQLHLAMLVSAALAPDAFDPRTSERTVRIGLSDANEDWLLPPLMRALERDAPRLRLIVVPVQFRTVGEALTSQRVDLAVTVADALPAGIERRALFSSGFVCVFDPRHARVGKKLTRAQYFAHGHVIVSYAGDLRGVVEDYLGVQRDVRASVPGFQAIGPIVEGSALLATVPAMVARQILTTRPHLRVRAVPVRLEAGALELLWRTATDDDDALRLVRDHVVRISERASRGLGRLAAA